MINKYLEDRYDSANLAWLDCEKIQDERYPFPSGESLKDIEKRVANFIEYIKTEHEEKTIAIVAHRAPQLAIEVLTKNITWKEAIEKDWRKTKSWQPGWKYVIDE